MRKHDFDTEMVKPEIYCIKLFQNVSLAEIDLRTISEFFLVENFNRNWMRIFSTLETATQGAQKPSQSVSTPDEAILETNLKFLQNLKA